MLWAYGLVDGTYYCHQKYQQCFSSFLFYTDMCLKRELFSSTQLNRLLVWESCEWVHMMTFMYLYFAVRYYERGCNMFLWICWLWCYCHNRRRGEEPSTINSIGHYFLSSVHIFGVLWNLYGYNNDGTLLFTGNSVVKCYFLTFTDFLVPLLMHTLSFHPTRNNFSRWSVYYSLETSMVMMMMMMTVKLPFFAFFCFMKFFGSYLLWNCVPEWSCKFVGKVKGNPFW